jgi:hypothetical protein
MRFVARNDWECGTDTWLAGARMHFCRSRQSFLPRLASKHPWHGRVRGHMGTRRSHGRKHRTLSAPQPDQLPQPAGACVTRRQHSQLAVDPTSSAPHLIIGTSGCIHRRRATGHAPARRALASSRPFRIGAVGSDFIDHGSETTGARLLAASGSGQARIGSKVYPFFQGKRRWKAY